MTFKLALSDGDACWEWGDTGCWKLVRDIETHRETHTKCRDRNIPGMFGECVWESKPFLEITVP